MCVTYCLSEQLKGTVFESSIPVEELMALINNIKLIPGDTTHGVQVKTNTLISDLGDAIDCFIVIHRYLNDWGNIEVNLSSITNNGWIRLFGDVKNFSDDDVRSILKELGAEDVQPDAEDVQPGKNWAGCIIS